MLLLLLVATVLLGTSRGFRFHLTDPVAQQQQGSLSARSPRRRERRDGKSLSVARRISRVWRCVTRQARHHHRNYSTHELAASTCACSFQSGVVGCVPPTALTTTTDPDVQEERASAGPGHTARDPPPLSPQTLMCVVSLRVCAAGPTGPHTHNDAHGCCEPIE